MLDRLAPERHLRFFTREEEPCGRALLGRLVGNAQELGIPVFEMVDGRLAGGSTDGWRYDDMPTDAAAWRRSLAELGQMSFATLSMSSQRDRLESIRTSTRFADMPAARLWGLWMRYACTAFYSHPSAWSEIGFGGPAYPRGYRNMGLDRREPWEVADVDARDPVPWARTVEASPDPELKRKGTA